MASVEQSVKSQFAKVFTARDWLLFKKMAESNLREAANLLMNDMPIERNLRLLARNSRKRLLIGVGVELLLKAAYLKLGYAINTLPKDCGFKFPFLSKDVKHIQLAADKTVILSELIEKLPIVVDLLNKDVVLKGFRIAKVFRNKEGHSVSSTHEFDPTNYTDIELSLVELYRDVFGEKLTVQFSFAANEPAIWRTSQIRRVAAH